MEGSDKKKIESKIIKTLTSESAPQPDLFRGAMLILINYSINIYSSQTMKIIIRTFHLKPRGTSSSKDILP